MKLKHLHGYSREVARYWRAAASTTDFLSTMQVRLALSKAGPLLCRQPRTVQVDLKPLGPAVHLRTHTSDVSVLAELIVHRGYDCVLPHLEAPPRTIVDLGANIGLSARWLLHRWPGAQLTAVEPDPANAAILRRNLRPYQDQTRIHQACIGAIDRRARLLHPGHAWACRLVDESEETRPGEARPIDVISMSRLMTDMPSVDIDLLKCDIEGTERELFASCDAWIQRVRLAVVECHGDYDGDDLLEAIARNGGTFDLVARSAKGAWNCEVVVLKRA
jgi:FkbM family methyltransferase